MPRCINRNECDNSPELSSRDLVWRKTDAGHSLHLRSSRRALAHIIPDQNYPGIMWRVRMPDGRLSDMANLPRAKDAAVSAVLRTENRDLKARQAPRRNFLYLIARRKKAGFVI